METTDDLSRPQKDYFTEPINWLENIFETKSAREKAREMIIMLENFIGNCIDENYIIYLLEIIPYGSRFNGLGKTSDQSRLDVLNETLQFTFKHGRLPTKANLFMVLSENKGKGKSHGSKLTAKPPKYENCLTGNVKKQRSSRSHLRIRRSYKSHLEP